MLRSIASPRTKSVFHKAARRCFSSPGPLEADSGAMATRVHHGMTAALAVATPLYFVLPEESGASRGLGALLGTAFAAHSWIGMNYVATDYVPKVSKALLGPARYFNAGLAFVTLVGLTKMSLTSPGGIKGALRGLWNPKPKDESQK